MTAHTLHTFAHTLHTNTLFAHKSHILHTLFKYLHTNIIDVIIYKSVS